MSDAEPFGLSELGGSAFVRIVTNPKFWVEPTTTQDAFDFMEDLRRRSNARLHARTCELGPVCEAVPGRARSRKLVADACHAALALEHGCELVSADADFARFIGLRHRHPLA